MSGPAGGLLLIGGSGRLGGELRRLLPGAVAPPRSELDLTRPESVRAALDRYLPELVVHAAAFTDVSRAETERRACWRVNVEGTRHLAAALAAGGPGLVFISTDYVFDGRRGMYREDDPVGPPANYYGLSKLVAEELVRLVPRHLVIRTSFRGRDWPHPVAYTDLFTSQDYLDVIAPELALAIARWREIPWDTLHVATERKSAYELARRRRPGVRAGSKREAGVPLPDDVSLDTSRWQTLKALLGRCAGRAG